jgi:arylformamidase
MTAEPIANAIPSLEKIWLNYNQTELDRAYNQSNFAANMQEVLARYASKSEAYRLKNGVPQRFEYGASNKEGFDFYPTKIANAATQIFIHGGAWRGGLAKNYGFLAEFFGEAGINLIVADFDRAEDATHGLVTMVDQVCRVVQWVYVQAASLNIERDKLHFFGHSSGAHLVACALTTDWQTDYGLPANTIRSAVCTSGIYDLAPVRLSSRNGYLKLTDAVEHSLSPQRLTEAIKSRLLIAHGSKESPEFIRQAKSFANAINSHRVPDDLAQLLEIEGANHFEVLESLTQPNSALGQAIISLF